MFYLLGTLLIHFTKNVNQELKEAFFSTVTGLAATIVLTIFHSTVLIATIIGKPLINEGRIYGLIGIVLIISYFLVYQNKEKILAHKEILLNDKSLKRKWERGTLIYVILLIVLIYFTIFSTNYGSSAMIK